MENQIRLCRCIFTLYIVHMKIWFVNFVRDIDSLLHTKKAKAEVLVPEVSMDEGERESEAEPMAQENEDNQPKITLLVS